MEQCYEFAAPQFVDFTCLDNHAEDSDEEDFFSVDMETGEPSMPWVGLGSSMSQSLVGVQPVRAQHLLEVQMISPHTGRLVSTRPSPEPMSGGRPHKGKLLATRAFSKGGSTTQRGDRKSRGGRFSTVLRNLSTASARRLPSSGGHLPGLKVHGRRGRMTQARKNLGTPSASRRPKRHIGTVGLADTKLSKPRAGRGVCEVFRSQAEQIRHFHAATPQRFRTPPNTNAGHQEGKGRRNNVRGNGSKKNSSQWKEDRKDGPQAQHSRPASLTMPQPFQLEGSKRVERRLAAWQQEVAREQEAAQQAKVFRATPATVLETPPFAPKRATRPPTVPVSGPTLETIKRAEEREQFEARRRAREEQEELLRALQQQERDHEEARAINQLRKQTVHRARPVPNYRKIEVKQRNKSEPLAVSRDIC